MARVCDECYENAGGSIKKKDLQKKRSSIMIKSNNAVNLSSFVSFWALPERIMCLIFGFLDLYDLVQATLTCKTWRNLCEKDPVWKAMFCKRWIEPGTEEMIFRLPIDLLDQPYSKSWKTRYQTESHWEEGQYSMRFIFG